MTKPRRSLENRGKSTSYVTTGGAGYVPPAIDADAVVNKISNLWNYGKAYLKNKFSGTGDGTFINLSDKNVSRIKSDTKGVKTILTNEFVERNKNTVRKKKDFVNTTDTLLGDRHIPLSKISTFYGVENGKLKAGPLSSFSDETVVVPNRGKNIGKIVKYVPGTAPTEEFKEAVENGVRKYNKDHNFKPTFAQRIFNYGIPFISEPDPRGVLYRNVGRDKQHEILDSIETANAHLGRGSLSYVITEKGDTINGYRINATPKTMFADEQGNAAFVSNVRNPKNVKQLNAFLAQNPAYPIMVDNGRYSSYMDNVPNAEIYGGLNRPDDMFIIGTTDRTKHKDGGSIHIAPSKRGTFTAAATNHGMGVQEFAARVLRNKEDYSPSLVKKANFARNASKWH